MPSAEIDVEVAGRKVRIVGVVGDNERETLAERFNIAPSGKRFRCNFIEPGLVSYTDVGGDVELLRRETIEDALRTALGNPLTIGHVRTNKMVTDPHGQIEHVGRDPETGWFFADGSVDTDRARDRLRNNGKPSCGYTVLEFGPGGTWHNMPYARELKRIKFHHLAIVDNPRYEGSRFRLNSKTQPAMKNPFKFLWNTDKPAAEAGGQPTTERAEAEVAPDATVEIDGKPVRMNELVELYQNPARENEITPESEIEYTRTDKKVVKAKFSDLVQAHEDRENGVESPAAKAKREETERKNSQAEADRQAAEDRENGKKSFRVLSSARATPPPAASSIPVSASSGSESEGFSRGASRYSSPSAPGKN